jgi:hypothetical protein
MLSGFPVPLFAITIGTVIRGRDSASVTNSGYRLDCRS